MASKLRLLMTTDAKNSEIWDYSLILSRTLLKHINVEILILGVDGNITVYQKEELDNLNLKYESMSLPLDMVAGEKSNFNGLITEFNPHIIHFNHGCADFDVNKPCILTCHGNFLNNKFNINKNLDKADAIITKSRVFTESIVKTYDLKKKIQIIYSGVDYTPHFEIPENPVLVTYENPTSRSRGLNLLLNIAHRLPDNIKIKIICDSIPNKKTPKNVEFLCDLSNAERQFVYRDSSIYLALSNNQYGEMSSIQAAYSGCAILSNNIPIYKELWGDCACIFEKDNIHSFIRCINNLVENRNLLEITSKKCHTKALSVFNSRRMAFEYINLYKNILKSYHSTKY